MGYIGQASSDENNGITGPKPGDQTGSEINKKSWYSYPWNVYLECTDTEIAEAAASYMSQIINDDNYGYSQTRRWSGLNSILANNKKVKGGSGDFDCSSIIISCYILAGVNMSADGTTSTLKSKLLATGLFKAYSDAAHIGSGSAAKKGGVYIGSGHACMSLDSGSSGSSTTTEVVKRYLGKFTLTAYCPCVICTGKTDGITASGVKAKANHTIAVDTSVIPLGSKVEINGKIYYAEDTGGAIKGNKIDIFFNSHNEALAFGTQSADVYIITENVKESSSSKTELTSVVIASVSGDGGVKKEYLDTASTGDSYNLYIVHNSEMFVPIIQDGVSWKTYRKGSPASLEFTVVKDNVINFQEGDTVIFKHNDVGVFYGYVFTKSRRKDGLISVTAYDQLRYFKNKDTYIYTDKRADELYKMIAEDYMLNLGQVDNTGYSIPNKIEDNQTLFDIMQNAIDDTLDNTGKMFIIYDDFGKLALRDVNSLKLDLLLTEEVAEDLSYSSSIDSNTYNRIQLYIDDNESGVRKEYIYQDGNNISQWGVLQFTQKLDEEEYPDVVGNELLTLYNEKTRNLSLSGVFGCIEARAGASVAVQMTLGDISVNTYMVIEKAVHNFEHGKYTMDLTLTGGTFVA